MTYKEGYTKTIQAIRLMDVFLLGPFLMFVGLKYPLPKGVKILLIISGFLTIVYNGKNYLKFKQAK